MRWAPVLVPSFTRDALALRGPKVREAGRSGEAGKNPGSASTHPYPGGAVIEERTTPPWFAAISFPASLRGASGESARIDGEDFMVQRVPN